MSEANEKKQITKVTTGKVTTHKPSIAKKAANTFLAEDLDNVREHIVFDVVVPMIKNVILDTIEMALFGSTSRYRGTRRNDDTRNYTSYSTYSRYSGYDSRDRRSSSDRRGPSDLSDILFETRIDAEEVIGVLYETLNEYGRASVADLYDACGITGDYTDNRWGWTKGAEFHVKPVAGGYTLIFPRVKLLD